MRATCIPLYKYCIIASFKYQPYFNRWTTDLNATQLLTLHHNTFQAFPCDVQSSKVDTALDWLTWDTAHLLKMHRKTISQKKVS